MGSPRDPRAGCSSKPGESGAQRSHATTRERSDRAGPGVCTCFIKTRALICVQLEDCPIGWDGWLPNFVVPKAHQDLCISLLGYFIMPNPIFKSKRANIYMVKMMQIPSAVVLYGILSVGVTLHRCWGSDAVFMLTSQDKFYQLLINSGPIPVGFQTVDCPR